jgi:2-dehydropantoate 2-reductase
MTIHDAILGAGGVGGFIGAALSQGGHDVTLLLRAETLAAHPAVLQLESAFGNISAPVRLRTRLDHDVDVLWITVKATQLEAALAHVPHDARVRAVVPLLNGVDHVATLRARFGHDVVVPATIAIESERVAPGHIVHRSPFARLAFAGAGRAVLAPAVAVLERFGCTCAFVDDEPTLLWRKLVILAPFALTNTAKGGTIGDVRDDPSWLARLEGVLREACLVARAEGARVDDAPVDPWQALLTFPAFMRSSMSKDAAAGNALELDAIAGPILRGGRAHGIGVPCTAELAAAIQARYPGNAIAM